MIPVDLVQNVESNYTVIASAAKQSNVQMVIESESVDCFVSRCAPSSH